MLYQNFETKVKIWKKEKRVNYKADCITNLLEAMLGRTDVILICLSHLGCTDYYVLSTLYSKTDDKVDAEVIGGHDDEDNVEDDDDDDDDEDDDDDDEIKNCSIICQNLLNCTLGYIYKHIGTRKFLTKALWVYSHLKSGFLFLQKVT